MTMPFFSPFSDVVRGKYCTEPSANVTLIPGWPGNQTFGSGLPGSNAKSSGFVQITGSPPSAIMIVFDVPSAIDDSVIFGFLGSKTVSGPTNTLQYVRPGSAGACGLAYTLGISGISALLVGLSHGSSSRKREYSACCSMNGRIATRQLSFPFRDASMPPAFG